MEKRKNIYCLTHNDDLCGETAFIEQLTQAVTVILIRLEHAHIKNHSLPNDDVEVLLKSARRTADLLNLRKREIEEEQKEASHVVSKTSSRA